MKWQKRCVLFWDDSWRVKRDSSQTNTHDDNEFWRISWEFQLNWDFSAVCGIYTNDDLLRQQRVLKLLVVELRVNYSQLGGEPKQLRVYTALFVASSFTAEF